MRPSIPQLEVANCCNHKILTNNRDGWGHPMPELDLGQNPTVNPHPTSPRSKSANSLLQAGRAGLHQFNPTHFNSQSNASNLINHQSYFGNKRQSTCQKYTRTCVFLAFSFNPHHSIQRQKKPKLNSYLSLKNPPSIHSKTLETIPTDRPP